MQIFFNFKCIFKFMLMLLSNILIYFTDIQLFSSTTTHFKATTTFRVVMLALVAAVLGLSYLTALKDFTHLNTVCMEMHLGPYIYHTIH